MLLKNFFPSSYQAVLYHYKLQCKRNTRLYDNWAWKNGGTHRPFSPPCTLEPQRLATALHTVLRGAHSGLLQLKDPFLCRVSFMKREGNEFHFMSGLRGEEPLSCLEQGWDALNKGGVAAVKQLVLARREAGKETAAPLLTCSKKTWVHAWHITT